MSKKKPASAAASSVGIRDRVKEFRRVKASELVPNPKNWRRHPQAQLDAIRGVLREVGFAGAELARELPDGRLMLIDGHARAEIAGDDEVPVLVLDVTEQEADKLLVTFDPLGAMAEADANAFDLLVSSFEFDEASLRRITDDLLNDAEFAVDGSESDSSRENKSAPNAVKEQDMELKPEEHYDYIVILADNVNDWNRLVRLFSLPTINASRRHQRLGIARGVKAAKVLELIDK